MPFRSYARERSLTVRRNFSCLQNYQLQLRRFFDQKVYIIFLIINTVLQYFSMWPLIAMNAEVGCLESFEVEQSLNLL